MWGRTLNSFDRQGLVDVTQRVYRVRRYLGMFFRDIESADRIGIADWTSAVPSHGRDQMVAAGCRQGAEELSALPPGALDFTALCCSWLQRLIGAEHQTGKKERRPAIRLSAVTVLCSAQYTGTAASSQSLHAKLRKKKVNFKSSPETHTMHTRF